MQYNLLEQDIFSPQLFFQAHIWYKFSVTILINTCCNKSHWTSEAFLEISHHTHMADT